MRFITNCPICNSDDITPYTFEGTKEYAFHHCWNCEEEFEGEIISA